MEIADLRAKLKKAQEEAAAAEQQQCAGLSMCCVPDTVHVTKSLEMFQ